MKILLIIDSLEVGGAEVFFQDLAAELSLEYNLEIVTLNSIGAIGHKMLKQGYKINNFNFNTSYFPIFNFLSLFQYIRKSNPDIVHTWMYYSNFIGGFAAFFAGIKKIVWSIHAFNISQGLLKRRTIMLAKFSALLARLIPNKIIFCSKESLNIHREIRYPSKKLLTIPNAVNVNKFSFSESGRASIRDELNLLESHNLIGMIGRYDPQKNQAGFIEAASIVHKSYPNTYFFIAGRGIDLNNKDLTELIATLKLEKNIYLLGERDDVNSLLSAADIFALPSYGEAFPISLCEAMSCSVPCIATDVGDVRHILGNYKHIISPGNTNELVSSISEIISLDAQERKDIGFELRERITQNFTIEAITKIYTNFYSQIYHA
jgi:glycosyltransferase involved in cell wall biosynthesis